MSTLNRPPSRVWAIFLVGFGLATSARAIEMVPVSSETLGDFNRLFIESLVDGNSWASQLKLDRAQANGLMAFDDETCFIEFLPVSSFNDRRLLQSVELESDKGLPIGVMVMGKSLPAACKSVNDLFQTTLKIGGIDRFKKRYFVVTLRKSQANMQLLLWGPADTPCVVVPMRHYDPEGDRPFEMDYYQDELELILWGQWVGYIEFTHQG